MGKTSLLLSDYIIDGSRMEATPGQMLEMACGRVEGTPEEAYESIVDESIDPSPEGTFSPSDIGKYATLTKKKGRTGLPLSQIGSHTKTIIAQALTDAIWRAGHFRLNDLQVGMKWMWDPSGTGSQAAFYGSVESACDYLDSLGITMEKYTVEEGRDCRITAEVSLSGNASSDDKEFIEEDIPFFDELPFRTEHPRLLKRRKCPATASGSHMDWIVFIPFDTCAPRLGGSLLSRMTGIPGGMAPAIADPDYFIDCYEVIREMVEDGIITAGITVGEGGLMRALSEFMPEGMGIGADLGGMAGSYGENDIVRLLFSEIPGVIIEIKDTDYDYLDAELLLQDVAFYPLGHVSDAVEGVRASIPETGGLSGILQSLLSGGASEGED